MEAQAKGVRFGRKRSIDRDHGGGPQRMDSLAANLSYSRSSLS